MMQTAITAQVTQGRLGLDSAQWGLWFAHVMLLVAAKGSSARRRPVWSDQRRTVFQLSTATVPCTSRQRTAKWA